MTVLRQQKIAGIANDIPPLEVHGPANGDLLVLGWGSTYGAIRSAVERLQAEGWSVAHAPPAPPESVPGATSRRSCAATSACSCPRSTWASCRCSCAPAS